MWRELRNPEQRARPVIQTNLSVTVRQGSHNSGGSPIAMHSLARVQALSSDLVRSIITPRALKTE